MVIVNGIRYELLDRQRVDCASWEHIAHALEASVGVLKEVFTSPNVRKNPDPLMDQYAWELAAAP